MTDTPPADPAIKAMRLRADPPRPLRLSRKAAFAGAGVLALVVAIAVGVGLLGPKTKEAPETELTSASAPPPDAVRALPGDYQAPRLGEPLPGDLGEPILNARTAADAQAPLSPETGEGDRAADARQAALQRLQAEAEAARVSTVLAVQGGADAAGTVATPSAMDTAWAASGAGEGVWADGGQGASLLAGAVIEAGLVTGVRSDLPGPVLGQITADVYDSRTGRRLLIPKGSRLIGAHEAEVSQGQARLQVVWSRLLLPNGQSIALGAQIASDPQGYAGLQDGTDRRWGERLGSAALTTLLAMSAAAVDLDAEDRWGRTARDGVTRGVDTLGRGLVEQGLSLPPRLTLRPGFAFRIILTEDLDLPPYGE